MAKYKLGGKIYEAESEADARAQHARAKGSVVQFTEAPAGTPKENPKATSLARASADFLNSFVDRTGTTARKAVGLALPQSMEPSWATKDAIKAREAETKPQTGAGSAGSLASDWAGGTLLGAGPEIGLAKIGMAALPRAGAYLRGAGRVAANAGSGALQGAVLASPDEVGTGAAVGAASSGTLGTLGEAGRGVLRVLGKNRVDPKAAQVLAKLRSVDPDASIPNSHLLKPGFLRSIYEGVVANAPLSGGTMRRQHADAVNTGYRALVAETTPVNTPLDTVFPRGGSVHDAMTNLNPARGSGGAYDRSLGRFNQEMFDTSGFQLPQHIDEALSATRNSGVTGNDMTGEQLISLRDKIQRVRDQIVQKKFGGDEVLAHNYVRDYDKAREEILDIMKRGHTDPNGQVDQTMQDYLDDLGSYKEYDTFKNAVKQTPDGEPGFGAVAMSAVRKSPDAGVMGQAGPLQDLGNDFASVLGDFPSKQGIFQMGASQGMTEGAARAVIPGSGQGNLLVKAGALAANPVLGSKLVQRKVAEGFSSARSLENFLEKYPSFGRFVRSGAISAVQEE